MEGPARPLVIRELKAAEPGPFEVTVRLSASGVCHTDLSVLHGALPVPVPAVLGHEGAGVVERIGSAVQRVRPGDRVITCAAGACGHCYFCVRGEPQTCEQITTLVRTPRFADDDGGLLQGYAGLGTFAEQITVHESSVIPVRSELPRAQRAAGGAARAGRLRGGHRRRCRRQHGQG
jgi:S-(hydroxymethyl)glutathione dehydrogenase/alcohol dehydrogenase